LAGSRGRVSSRQDARSQLGYFAAASSNEKVEMDSNFRVLYVEDDADSREMVDFLLRVECSISSVKSVANSADAMREIDQGGFDLYILDAWMPGLSGFDLCRHIRETDKNTPVMFFSALSRESDRELAAAAGASAFLCKPNDLDIFSDTVDTLLAKTRLERAKTRSKPAQDLFWGDARRDTLW
jgi:DNA-binding response OmpR family regulator